MHYLPLKTFSREKLCLGRKKLFYTRGAKTRPLKAEASSLSIISLVHIWLIQAVIGCSEEFIKHFLISELACPLPGTGKGSAERLDKSLLPKDPPWAFLLTALLSFFLFPQLSDMHQSKWTEQSSREMMPALSLLIPCLHTPIDVGSLWEEQYQKNSSSAKPCKKDALSLQVQIPQACVGHHVPEEFFDFPFVNKSFKIPLYSYL